MVGISFLSVDRLTPGCIVDADAVIQQFYPGELGGLALAEVLFGDVNPSGA